MGVFVNYVYMKFDFSWHSLAEQKLLFEDKSQSCLPFIPTLLILTSSYSTPSHLTLPHPTPSPPHPSHPTLTTIHLSTLHEYSIKCSSSSKVPCLQFRMIHQIPNKIILPSNISPENLSPQILDYNQVVDDEISINKFGLRELIKHPKLWLS